ncbi:hypothetical protein V1477_014953 [Vespula maculifrons]|uniref:Uncharacterized protein n=1 Tax=Vespula maculifrons TaxID=7453 RepID=A0ABD2BIX3_VESMC
MNAGQIGGHRRQYLTDTCLQIQRKHSRDLGIVVNESGGNVVEEEEVEKEEQREGRNDFYFTLRETSLVFKSEMADWLVAAAEGQGRDVLLEVMGKGLEDGS